MGGRWGGLPSKHPASAGADASNFWSGSSYVPNPANAWSVAFGYGFTVADFKTSGFYVRLVRGGQSFDSFDLLNPYSVTYDGNTNTGGSVPTDGNAYATSDTVTVLGNTGALVKTGYSFAGWNTAADGSGTAYAGGATFAMGSGDVTLYAQWTINTYTVTYNGNGSTGGTVPVDAGAYANGATVTVLANTGSLTRTGYTFAGWNTQAGGGGTSYAASGSATFAMGSGNVTLYAQWTLSAVTSYTAPSATGTGNITASFIGGGAGCAFAVSRFIPLTGDPASPPAGSAPAGVSFPHGLFDFTASGCTAGGTLDFTIVYPQALPPGTQYWKYGPTPTDAAPHWYVLPATIAGDTATFSITDGGLGDDDIAANGTIVDQGGPGAGLTGIPTLGEWAMLVLVLLLGLMGARRMRRA